MCRKWFRVGFESIFIDLFFDGAMMSCLVIIAFYMLHLLHDSVNDLLLSDYK